VMVVALALLLIGLTAWGALDKATYRGGVYWTDRHGAVIAGITSAGAFTALTSITATTFASIGSYVDLNGYLDVDVDNDTYYAIDIAQAGDGGGFKVDNDGTGNTILLVDGSTTRFQVADGGAFTFAGTTAALTFSTSWTNYTPSWVLGYDAGAWLKIAVADTTGNVTITQTGANKSVTWTAPGGFDFVGALAADAVTLSDVLTFSDGGTIDNTAADTLTITETTIALAGDVNVSGAIDDAVGTNDGVLYVSQFTVTYAQTVSYTVCTIPANADVLKIEVLTTTAFTGGSATTIDIGWSGNTDKYTNDLNIRSAGYAVATGYGYMGDVGGSDRDILAQITTDDSAGSATVLVYWTRGTPGTP